MTNLTRSEHPSDLANIDWSRVALNLCMDRTVAKTEKAAICGMGTVQLDRLKNHMVRCPRWDQGVRMLGLHARLFPDKKVPEERTCPI